MEARHLRESALIPCHLRLQDFLFLTADVGGWTRMDADGMGGDGLRAIAF